MKSKETFQQNILKINKNDFLSINRKKNKHHISHIKNEKEQYSIKKDKFSIFKNKINEIIKKHHDELL